MTTATQTAQAPKACASCGKGVFRSIDVKGRTFAFRDERALELTQSIVLPVCTVCDEIRESESNAAALDALLEQTYHARHAAIANNLLRRLLDLGWRQSEIEQAMGLSTGYLSKVLRGEKSLATSTLRLLIHLALHPRGTLQDLAQFFPQVRELEQTLERRGALAAA